MSSTLLSCPHLETKSSHFIVSESLTNRVVVTHIRMLEFLAIVRTLGLSFTLGADVAFFIVVRHTGGDLADGGIPDESCSRITCFEF
jgi:hypothetical protein